MTDLRQAATVARQYIGEHEKPQNSGFMSSTFEVKMKSVGWDRGQAWCAYFTELVWKEAFPDYFQLLDELFSASAVNNWKIFSNHRDFICDREFRIGCLCIWQMYMNGKPHWTGHMGIGSSLIVPENFLSIEGNTNSYGGREGVEVAERNRSLNFEPKEHGLVLLGFVKIKGL